MVMRRIVHSVENSLNKQDMVVYVLIVLEIEVDPIVTVVNWASIVCRKVKRNVYLVDAIRLVSLISKDNRLLKCVIQVRRMYNVLRMVDVNVNQVLSGISATNVHHIITISDPMVARMWLDCVIVFGICICFYSTSPCTCYEPGSLQPLQCNAKTGQCNCKTFVEGQNCDKYA